MTREKLWDELIGVDKASMEEELVLESNQSKHPAAATGTLKVGCTHFHTSTHTNTEARCVSADV